MASDAARTIILPSENQFREFDAKLLTACALAEGGARAMVGARHEIHNRIGALDADLYLAKDYGRPSARILELIDGLGMGIAALDEEALVAGGAEAYYGRRTHPASVSLVRDFFAWGPRSAALFTGIPGLPGAAIHETGNPRLDFLRPELRAFHAPEVEALEREYGRFILINSNFGIVNPIARSRNGRRDVMKAQHPDLFARYERRRTVFAAFQRLLPKLARAFPETRIIVRPHPSEDPEAWRRSAPEGGRISILHTGEVIPWLLASGATLHNSCTTGLESHLLEKTPISFLGSRDVKEGALAPDFFSAIADDEDMAIDMVRASLEGALKWERTAAQQMTLDAHIAAWTGPLAADRLSGALRKIASPRRPASGRARVRAQARGAEKALLGLIPRHKAGGRHNRHRYPGVSPSALEDKLARLRAALGRFDGVRTRHLGGEIHMIEPADG